VNYYPFGIESTFINQVTTLYCIYTMTSDSSDDDSYGGMLDSPVSSDDDNDDDGDKNTTKKSSSSSSSSSSVFKFNSQKFGASTSSTSTSFVRPTKRIKRNTTSTTKKKARNQRSSSRRDIESNSDDSDSDSEMEEEEKVGKHPVVVKPKPKSKSNNTNNQKTDTSDNINNKKNIPAATNQETVELSSSDEYEASPQNNNSAVTSSKINKNMTSTNTTRLAALARTKKATTTTTSKEFTNLSSDDDDSDNDIEDVTNKPLPKNLPPDALAAIKRSQQAKAHLTQAQSYKAQDIHVAVPQETVGIIIPPTTTAATGRRILPGQTISIGSRGGSLHSKTVPLGNTLKFTCRCDHLMIKGKKQPTAKNNSNNLNLTIRENETISVLVEKFCKVHNLPPNSAKVVITFDGRRLDTKKTPKFYEMEDEDMIHVTAEATYLLAAGAASTSSSSTKATTTTTTAKTKAISRGKTLQFSLNFKITTAAPEVTAGTRRTKRQKALPKPVMSNKKLMLCENECLEVLVNKIYNTLDLPSDTTKVVMKFDGRCVDIQKTPKFYEMEDEDLIEVSVEKQEAVLVDPLQVALQLQQQQGGMTRGNNNTNTNTSKTTTRRNVRAAPSVARRSSSRSSSRSNPIEI
ncbi:MAG: hypothetical protein ACI8RD_000928, partial [Bacillariaceae sp.]|jgi:hypothetical protein